MTSHSDLGPSSKDWQPGSPGRDEDFTPDKDHWTVYRHGNVGAGRPAEDVHAGRVSGQAASGSPSGTGDTQPGTQSPGRSWQSRRPDPDDADAKLDQALQDTFPTSDPPAPALSGITGWDVGDSERNRGPGPNAPSPRTFGGAPHLTRRMADAPWRAAALVLVPALIATVEILRRSRRSRRR